MEEEIINSYLTFAVDGGLYGVHVSRVVEIQAYEKPEANPGGLPYLLGLIRHRGRVLPCIDSGVKFGLRPLNLNEQTYVVIISVKNGDELFDVALAVDEVRGVMDVPEEGRLKIDTAYKPGYVLFAAQADGGLAMFLDPDKVFNDTDVISMASITAEANKKQATK